MEVKEELHRKKASKVAPTVSGYRFYECPVGFINAESNFIIKLLDIGELPFPGGYLKQPQWFIEALELSKQIKNEWLNKTKP